MKQNIKLFMLLAFCLGMVSCEDTETDPGTAEVEIVLQAEKDSVNIEEAMVTLDCVTDKRDKVVIPAERVAESRYLATLPTHYTPCIPFITVSIGTDRYSFGVPETSFEAQKYKYRIYLGSGDCSIEMDTMGWEKVEVDIELP